MFAYTPHLTRGLNKSNVNVFYEEKTTPVLCDVSIELKHREEKNVLLTRKALFWYQYEEMSG